MRQFVVSDEIPSKHNCVNPHSDVLENQTRADIQHSFRRGFHMNIRRSKGPDSKGRDGSALPVLSRRDITLALGIFLALSSQWAQAIASVDYYVQGERYIIRFRANVNYPVDCQINWQVQTTGNFTRQGYAAANHVSGDNWSEVLGPMTTDVKNIWPTANCQLSYIERQKRAQEEARRQQENERREAQIRQQREAQERARATAAQQAEQARQEQIRQQKQEEQRRAHTLQVPDYSETIQRNEADRREYFQRQAEETDRRNAQKQQRDAQQLQMQRDAQQQLVKQAEERRQLEARAQATARAERIGRAQGLMQQSGELSQQMRQQTVQQDAVMSNIAAGGAEREKGMAVDASTAVTSRSSAEIQQFLQRQLDTGQ